MSNGNEKALALVQERLAADEENRGRLLASVQAKLQANLALVQAAAQAASGGGCEFFIFGRNMV